MLCAGDLCDAGSFKKKQTKKKKKKKERKKKIVISLKVMEQSVLDQDIGQT